jgi:hypothetical protein
MYWRVRLTGSDGNATMRCVCTVELHVNNIKISIIAQKCFYEEFISLSTIKRTYVFM